MLVLSNHPTSGEPAWHFADTNGLTQLRDYLKPILLQSQTDFSNVVHCQTTIATQRTRIRQPSETSRMQRHFQILLPRKCITLRPHSSSFWGSYSGSEKVIPKSNYYGAYGKLETTTQGSILEAAGTGHGARARNPN